MREAFGRNLAFGVFLVVCLLAHDSLCQTFTVGGSQEIGGAAPAIVGVGPVTITATGNPLWDGGTDADWVYTWSGYDRVALSDEALTYTRYSNPSTTPTTYYDRGTITFDLGGADLGGSDDDGTISVAAVRNRTGTGTDPSRNYRTDHVAITNVGDIGIGGIDTGDDTTSNTHYPHPGYITIGEEAARAGQIRIGFIYANAGAETRGNSTGGHADLAIYGSGAVRIENAAGSLGSIVLGSTVNGSGSTATINHFGELKAHIIDISKWNGNFACGSLTLNGGDASGNLQVGSLRAYRNGGNYPGEAGDITIALYANVAIGEIQAWNYDSTPNAGHTRDGGNVTITNGIPGNITIDGEINLRRELSSDPGSVNGTLDLACSGTVTLAALDLDKVHHAALDSGKGASVITGVLTNFDTTATGGSGSRGVPYVTSQTALRAPEGQDIYYSYEAEGVNDYLGGFYYRIANMAGEPGEGGCLRLSPALIPGGSMLILK